MRQNVVKRKLAEHRTTIGSWLTIGHPLISAILAPAGFDWLAIDMEHSSIGVGELLPLVMATEATGMVPLVRIGEKNPNLIKRVMDAGAYGIIAPDVRDESQATDVVSHVRYPPEGSRGVGLYVAQGFGRRFEEYKVWLQEESLVVIQIEHIEAVERIDRILSTPGIDAYMIGPYDLSASLGKPGQFDDPRVAEALETVMSVGKRLGVPAGIHAVSSDARDAAARVREGYRFVAYSVDSILLGDAACDGMSRLNREVEP